MKTFLTFFVLLFSSSLFAEEKLDDASDKLDGTSIVCGTIENDKTFKIFGIEFLTDNKVRIHVYFPISNDFRLSSDFMPNNLIYKTTFDLIDIYDKIHHLQINRKTLDIKSGEYKNKFTSFVSGENCMIIKNKTIGFYLLKMHQKLVNELKKDN